MQSNMKFRKVQHFVKQQAECFSEEVVRSIFLSNEINEHVIRELLSCNQRKEEKPSFRDFRKNRMNKPKETNNNDDVILVV